MWFFKNKKPDCDQYFSFVNRSAVILVAGPGYLEWAKHNPDETDDVESLMDEVMVYLIPEMDVDAEDWLQQQYRDLFEHELYAWCRDRKYWPEDLSYENFRRFFKIHFSSGVIDASGDELKNGYYE